MKMTITLQTPDLPLPLLQQLLYNLENQNFKQVLTILEQLQKQFPYIFHESMVMATLSAFEESLWNSSLNAFNDAIDQTYNFYMGPLKSIDKAKEAMSFIVLKKKQSVNAIYKEVFDVTELISRMLNIPCGFNGRYVEFYDVMFASQQYTLSAVNKIALFSPFYFANIELIKVGHRKRSIMFHNVIKARYEYLTKPLVNKVLIDGELPNILSADEQTVDAAIALWICLHELMHSSGPIPYFGSHIKKIKMGTDYAHIEEARVDMSSFVILSYLPEKWSKLALVTQELIFLERILRSARQIKFENYAKPSNFDCFHGLFWLQMLQSCGARVEKSLITLNKSNIVKAVKSTVQTIYDFEHSMLTEGPNAYTLMRDYALNIKKNLQAGEFFAFYNQFNHEIDFDLKFIC